MHLGSRRVADSDRPRVPVARLDRLVRESSLKGIAPALHDDPKIHLMHNADDFLVSAQDLAWAESIFGERATIYPHGGHPGNRWYPRATGGISWGCWSRSRPTVPHPHLEDLKLKAGERLIGSRFFSR